MSAALAVATREIRERWLLLALGGGGVALVALLSLFPAPHALGTAATMLAAALAFALPLAAAFPIGASLIGGDATSARLAFYFVRPITPLALWAGKVAAALALVASLVACGALALALSEGRSPLRLHPVSAGGALVACFVVAVAHLGATSFRSRSRWMIADVAGAALVSAAGMLVGREIALDGGATPLLMDVLPLVFLGALLAVLAGAYAQLAVGRADVVRGHRALSLTVWPLAALIVAGVGAFGAWLKAAGPAQLGVRSPLEAAPAGPGLFVGTADGRGRLGYAPVFVMNTDTGRWTPFAGDRFTLPAFDPDGALAAWVATPPGGGELRPPGLRHACLALARFDGPVPVVEERSLPPGEWERVLALHAAGSRAAIQKGPALVLVDVATARETGIVVPAQAFRAVFRDRGTLRVWAAGDTPGTAVVAFDYDLARGSRTERARVPGLPVAARVLLADPRGDVAIVQQGTRQTVVDASRGTSADLPASSTPAHLLADGSLAFGLGDTLRVVDRDGAPVRTVAIPQARVQAVSEPFPGQIAVDVFDATRFPWWRTVMVDAATGAVTREEAGLRFVRPSWGWPPAPGTPGARLSASNGGLSRLEPGGSLRVIVPEQE